MTQEETLAKLQELGIEHRVNEEGKIILCGADLRGMDLREVLLKGADLRDADLRGTDLRAAGLRGANLRGARHNTQTRWPNQFKVHTRRAVFVPED